MWCAIWHFDFDGDEKDATAIYILILSGVLAVVFGRLVVYGLYPGAFVQQYGRRAWACSGTIVLSKPKSRAAVSLAAVNPVNQETCCGTSDHLVRIRMAI
jgi:hypothetical protein